MANITEIQFKKEDILKSVVVTYTDLSVKEIQSDLFGVVDGFEGYIAFWRSEEEPPFLFIRDSEIRSLEVIEAVSNGS